MNDLNKEIGASRRNEAEVKDVSPLLDNIAEQTKTTRNLFLVYLANLLYFVLTILSIQDIYLLRHSTVTLPLLQVAVNTGVFFFVGPSILITLFVYLQLHLYDLKQMTNELKWMDPENYEFVSYWVVLSGRYREDKGVGVLKSVIVGGALWITLPAAFALFAFWTMKRHDTIGTTIQMSFWLIGVIASLYFYRKLHGKQLFSWIVAINIGAPILRYSVILIPCILAWVWLLSTLSDDWINKGGVIDLKLYNEDISVKPANVDSTRYWAVLENINLNGANLQYAFLYRANLTKAQLILADLSFADLQGANLSGANMSDANLVETHLVGADLSSATFLNAFLIKSRLDSADFSYANLDSSILNSSHLKGAYLAFATFTGAVLSETHLEGTNFIAANLSGADFTSAYLDSAYLVNTYLDSAIFWDASLTGADLTCADLTGADFNGANLRFANIQGACLQYAQNLDSAKLEGCTFSETTIFPSGFNPFEREMIPINELPSVEPCPIGATPILRSAGI